MSAAHKRQCPTCPWKVGTDPDRDIPNGYSRELHAGLRCTIAEPGALLPSSSMMACHYSEPGAERVCVGWAVNQLGPGNNIALRLQAMRDERLHGLVVDGEQHERFEDTLP